MGEINLAGHSPATIKQILTASGGQCRCCHTEVNVRPGGASDHRVHTVSEDDLRAGRDVPALICASCDSAMSEGGFTSVVDFVFSTRPACPVCSTHRSSQIGYGLPTRDSFVNMPPWQHSGGCCVGPEQWRCRGCGHEW
jgi:hypothetical protein